MSEYRDLLERDLARLSPPRIALEQLERRRDRKQRGQRVRAGTTGLALAIGVAWVWASAIGSGTPADDTPGPSPLPDVAAEDYSVDLRSGAASRLPESFTTIGIRSGGYRVSPDGRQVLFEVVEDGSSVTQLYMASLDGSNVRKITSEPAGAVAGTWSPDGTKVAYIAGWREATDVTLKLLDLSSGDATVLATGIMNGTIPPGGRADVREFPFPSFSPDGRTILFTSDGFFLDIVPVTGGERTRLRSRAAWGSFSPDGSRIAYLDAQGANVRDRLWDYRGLRLAHPDVGAIGSLVAQDAEDQPVWSPDGSMIAYVSRDEVGLLHEIHVVDVTTGEVTKVAVGVRPAWLDDDTLIVESYGVGGLP